MSDIGGEMEEMPVEQSEELSMDTVPVTPTFQLGSRPQPPAPIHHSKNGQTSISTTFQQRNYSLNKDKQINKILKDAYETGFDRTFDNFDKNVSVKCSIGFFSLYDR